MHRFVALGDLLNCVPCVGVVKRERRMSRRGGGAGAGQMRRRRASHALESSVHNGYFSPHPLPLCGELLFPQVFMSSTHELEGWWDIGAQEGRIHGRMHVRVAVRDYPLFKVGTDARFPSRMIRIIVFRAAQVPDPVPFPVPALVMHRSFELREKVPLVFADGHEIVGTLRGDPSIGVQLIDVASRRMIYALRKNSFLKKVFTSFFPPSIHTPHVRRCFGNGAGIPRGRRSQRGFWPLLPQAQDDP